MNTPLTARFTVGNKLGTNPAQNNMEKESLDYIGT